MKKRIFAGVMALFMIFTLLSPVEAKAEENYGVSITLPEGAESVELTDEVPQVTLEGAMLTISGYEGEIVEAIAYYMDEEFGMYGAGFYPTEEEGTLVGELHFDIDAQGTYTLVGVSFYNEYYESFDIDTNLPESSFTVVNHITDREAPVISDVQMEGYGETFVQGQGETITITAKVTDEGLGIKEDTLAVMLEAANGEMFYKYMEKQAEDIYVATIYIDGEEEYGPLYNMDWRVHDISLVDKAGNYTGYSEELETLDLHFYVVDENGYCDKFREDILLSFYDANYDLIEEFYVSSSDRTATLEELLGSVPEYESDLGFEGWRIDGTDIVLQNDTEFYIPCSGCWFDFIPATTIKQVQVDIYCLDENGEMHWTGYEPYVIPEGTTYAELLEMLPTPESVNGCNFVGWQFSDSEIDLSEEVVTDFVDVEAIYDKIVISIVKEYLTIEGDYTLDFDTMTVEQGTTYGEVLELIEAPDTYPGCTFEGWTYSYLDGSLEDVVSAELMIAVSAEYDKYPVTILSAYVGDNGETVLENTKEVYSAGTLMQDIRDEWIAKLGDEAEGTSEWYCVILEEEISLMNCSMVMIAQYEEQVVVIYEPQYIKDAEGYGSINIEDIVAVINKDEYTEEKVIQYFEDEIATEFDHYKNATFVEWSYDYLDMNEDGYVDLVIVQPYYEYDTPVIYVYGEEVMIYALEAGQTISLPTEVDGYYVTWEDFDGNEYTDSYTVPSELLAGEEVHLYPIQGGKVEDENDTPTDPSQPVDPEQPDQPDQPADPNQPVDPEQPADPEKPADSEQPSAPSKPGATAPETSDGTNGVPFMAVLMIGVASIMLAYKKRQTI